MIVEVREVNYWKWFLIISISFFIFNFLKILMLCAKIKKKFEKCWIDEEDSIKRTRKKWKICAYYKTTKKKCNTLLWILYSLLEKEGFKLMKEKQVEITVFIEKNLSNRNYVLINEDGYMSMCIYRCVTWQFNVYNIYLWIVWNICCLKLKIIFHHFGWWD